MTRKVCKNEKETKFLKDTRLGKSEFHFYSGQGFISTKILKQILHEIDENLTDTELDGIIEEVDEDGSGTVDFDGGRPILNERFMQTLIHIFSICRVYGNDDRVKRRWDKASLFNSLSHFLLLLKETNCSLHLASFLIMMVLVDFQTCFNHFNPNNEPHI